ncbi:MAG: hypothetical protein EAY75_16605 [Bacteroidetes bacterium]|nr:MAG: hypothetical protein EAY75_16605 [Bacteroidota bacterium]
MYKAPKDSSSPDHINTIEYFFDTDPGFGKGTAVSFAPGADIINLNFTPHIASLTRGIHWLHIRSKTVTGKWSITAKQLVYKAPQADSPLPAITQMEYFINNDPGIGKGVPLVFNSADSLVNFAFPANIAGLSTGRQTFYIRSKDNAGKWSLTAVDTFNVTQTPPTQAILVNSVIIPQNGGPAANRGASSNKAASILSETMHLTVCAGQTLKLAFDPRGIFQGENSFRVELSNQNGSFIAPLVIGTTSGRSAQQISCNLPRHLTPGNNFKIRVSSNNPAITGEPNLQAIKINDIDLGADTTVRISCPGNTVNLAPLYNITGLTSSWNTSNIANAPVGEYRLIVNNSTNCPDTAFASVVLETATWLGTVSNNWHTAGNWSTGKVPSEKTHVLVPAGTTNPCVISAANAMAASLQAKPGANVQATNGQQLLLQGQCATLPN